MFNIILNIKRIFLNTGFILVKTFVCKRCKPHNNKLQTALGSKEPGDNVFKRKLIIKVIKERNEEIVNKKKQTEKCSCSKWDLNGKTDQQLDTHIVMKHFKVNLSGTQQIDKYECNECVEYFIIREALIKHVKKRVNIN